MDTSCLVCEILSKLSPDVAEEINDYILERSVTAEFAARSLSKHVSPVGTTTLKKHRAEKHARV